MKGGARVAWLAVALATAAPAAGAASFTLGEQAQAEALREGERSIISESFGDEWRVVNGSGESVSVLTPFHRLALAARHAAFRNEALTQQDRQRVLRDYRDRITLSVQLYGARPDFARHLRPRLLAGDREIAPALVQNEHTARPDAGRFLARCEYWFPTRDLKATAKLILIIANANGQPIARFPIDLAEMR
ncbi:MAG TPA: hypothetical protein VFR64_17220 [Methylomirabilota bacterium]|nr:hypothetical protein [Methylomirabilota bacterium]